MIKLTALQFKDLMYAANYEFREAPEAYKTLNKELIVELLSTAITWEWDENVTEIMIDKMPF